MSSDGQNWIDRIGPGSLFIVYAVISLICLSPMFPFSKGHDEGWEDPGAVQRTVQWIRIQRLTNILPGRSFRIKREGAG
ncbi:hypothetical protein PGTUg99_034779 [Puccinia graminis f. sp. tritici]|uniref:Uncharacterized protein n=1 Tax=Puccinia graminis f. sp. tritici TaxID=56615 RepID=A0A5B0RBU0_PUCGR|nr:hypothetical protein PGTUg99_034779 [Puccinia graminis f. sp. tritici]